MKLTQAERLIIYMLADIGEQTDNTEMDHTFIKQAIITGNEWALPVEMTGILHNESTSDAVKDEVFQILSAFRTLEMAYSSLTDDDKASFTASLPHTDGTKIFRGFDANNESEHYSAATFLIKMMNRYEEFEGRPLNSHAATLDNYREIVTKLDGRFVDDLDLNTLVEILS